jgi:hypothetical protein
MVKYVRRITLLRNWFKVIIAFGLCVMLLGILSLSERQQQLEDKINQSSKPEIEQPARITGKWQIILFQSGMIPPRVIKTSSYFVKDKIIWYADEVTGQELPLPTEAMIIPDDQRNLEQYGVFDIETLNAIYN